MVDSSPYTQVGLEDLVEWQSAVVPSGTILEVDLGYSSMNTGREIWAAFYVLESGMRDDGSLELSVRCLGAEEEESKKMLFKHMNGKIAGKIHMCTSRPCFQNTPDEDVVLHVTLVRIWTEESFRSAHCDYVTDHMMRQIPKWAAAPTPIMGVDPTPKRGGAPPKKTPTTSRRKKRTPPPGTESVAKDDKSGAGTTVTPEMRRKLRARLDAIREQTLGSGTPGVEDLELDAELEEDGCSEEDSIEHAPEESKLTGGTLITKVKKPLGSGKGVSKDPKAILALEDQNVSSFRSSRGQLVSQVLQASKLNRSGKKKKKKKDSQSGTKKLAQALKSILDGKEKSKDHKKKKKKRSRKRVLNADGVIVSCSDSSENSSSRDSEEDQQSSDSDYETPLKKRSRDHPGSVLQLLTSHVQQQLEQNATLDVENTSDSLTSGVKIMTYFMLHLKPMFPTALRELREMHHIAACLDTLRQGDVARTGDGMAARFMAIHQSLLDQGWQTARHMELHPLEEASAAGPSVVLATRKHSKLVAKVTGTYQPTTWNFNAKGRGRGGKSDWYSGYDAKGDGKNEKGKGKKGKGKRKGKTNQWDWSNAGGEWKEKKDKGDDKTT